MNVSWWIGEGVTLLAGGTTGAIITAAVSYHKRRKQPIAYRMDIVPVFKGGMFSGSEILATLTLSSPLRAGYFQNVPNLSVVNIEISNPGNIDYSEFKWGITLSEGDVALHCTANPPDRFHQAHIVSQVGPSTPAAHLDFVLKPFNRRDKYTLTAYVAALNGAEEPGKIEIGSEAPVVFRDIAVSSEVLTGAAKLALEIGRISISVGQR